MDIPYYAPHLLQDLEQELSEKAQNLFVSDFEDQIVPFQPLEDSLV